MFCSQKTHTHYVIYKISYLFSNTIHKYYEPTKTMEKSRTRGPLISSPKFQNLDFKSSICKIANPSKQSKSKPSLEFYNEFERERERVDKTKSKDMEYDPHHTPKPINISRSSYSCKKILL